MKNNRERTEFVDKASELKILNLIYPPKENLEINDKCEEPDFIITNNKTTFDLGVEVTELFRDETAARLIKHQNYITEITKHNSFKHKDDKKALKIVSLTTIPDIPDEKPQVFKGIVREKKYTYDDFVCNLCHVIDTKTKKYINGYNKDLDAIDLIIYNHDLSFLDYAEDFLWAIMSSGEVTERLKKTPFREIYFVSLFKEKAPQYIQLKSQQLASMSTIFDTAFFKRYCEFPYDSSPQDFLNMFAVFLAKLGFRDIAISSKGVPAIYYATVKITVDINNALYIREFRTEHCRNKFPIDCNFVTKKPVDDELIRITREVQKTCVPKLSLLFET